MDPVATKVLELVDEQIEYYEKALAGGRRVTLDADTLTGAWRRLRAQIVALDA